MLIWKIIRHVTNICTKHEMRATNPWDNHAPKSFSWLQINQNVGNSIWEPHLPRGKTGHSISLDAELSTQW